MPAQKLRGALVGPAERVVAHHGERAGAHARAGPQPERLVERAEARAVRELEAPPAERHLAALAQERAPADVVDLRAGGAPRAQEGQVEALERMGHRGRAYAHARVHGAILEVGEAGGAEQKPVEKFRHRIDGAQSTIFHVGVPRFLVSRQLKVSGGTPFPSNRGRNPDPQKLHSHAILRQSQTPFQVSAAPSGQRR